MKKLLGYITLPFKAHKEEKQYVSECVELGVASCGDTLEEAFKNLKDAVSLYLNTLEEEGERKRVFAERGIQIFPGKPPKPESEVSVRVRPHEHVSSETYPISLSV